MKGNPPFPFPKPNNFAQTYPTTGGAFSKGRARTLWRKRGVTRLVQCHKSMCELRARIGGARASRLYVYVLVEGP